VLRGVVERSMNLMEMLNWLNLGLRLEKIKQQLEFSYQLSKLGEMGDRGEVNDGLHYYVML
jgi:hypothetical protein